ncbi:MAG TPA: hypothetical protein EYM84_09925 [Flavobacteriales bacterium]|nr:hypothetical protein [Flavobacteriales bacterium]
MKSFAFWSILCLFYACTLDNNLKTIDSPNAPIKVLINKPELEKLQLKRTEALNVGKLFKGKNDWVSALITHEDKSIRAKVRLKGDLSDHWRHEKEWSLKVKLDGDKSIYGMNRFALQRPSTRGFLNEWYLHKLLSSAGLIALKYDFIEISINGDLLPVYAIEENIHKNLPNRHNRGKGVLFKFNGDFYWRHKPGLATSFYGARITPFQEKKVKKDQVLSAQLIKVRYNIDKFRSREFSTSNIFDCEQMAKLFVIIDLMGHHHATALDNIRFFYNSNTGLIEPIGYDNQLISDINNQGLLGANKTINNHFAIEKWNFTNDYWYQYLFADTVFMKEYIKQLEVMSNIEYLNDFFVETNVEFEHALGLIQKSYPDYMFKGKELIYSNQKYLRRELDNLYINDKTIVDIAKVYQIMSSIHKDSIAMDNNSASEIEMIEFNKTCVEGSSLYYINLALLDIIGCSKIQDALPWINGDGHSLPIIEYKYQVISQNIIGASNEFITRPLKDLDHLKKYIATLQNLCEAIDFSDQISEISWFNKVYQSLDINEKKIIESNRAFLIDYISPYKALYAELKGVSSEEKTIELEIQNIHMLPISVEVININGNQIFLNNAVVIEGSVNGQPLPKKKFHVKVGSSQFLLVKRIVDDWLFEIDQFDLNYKVLGSGFLASEKIIQH